MADFLLDQLLLDYKLEGEKPISAEEFLWWTAEFQQEEEACPKVESLTAPLAEQDDLGKQQESPAKIRKVEDENEQSPAANQQQQQQQQQQQLMYEFIPAITLPHGDHAAVFPASFSHLMPQQLNPTTPFVATSPSHYVQEHHQQQQQQQRALPRILPASSTALPISSSSSISPPSSLSPPSSSPSSASSSSVASSSLGSSPVSNVISPASLAAKRKNQVAFSADMALAAAMTNSIPSTSSSTSAASSTAMSDSLDQFDADEYGADDHDPNDSLAEKRKRNSAASARFRMKKKMREAELEKTAKDMTEKATLLQKRVDQLESEVAYLKELLILKSTIAAS